MTLSTHVFITSPVDIEALWDHCQDLIGAVQPRTNDEPSDYRSQRVGLDAGAVRNRWNVPGQGFMALLDMFYRPDGSEVPAEGHSDWCNEGCTGEHHDPAHFVMLDFDTAYSYSDAFGGVGALHARLLTMLSVWLQEREATWCWVNEFTGARYEGLAGVETLDKGGRNAEAWMREIVMPALRETFGDIEES